MTITRRKSLGAELGSASKTYEVNATSDYGGDATFIDTTYKYTGSYSFAVTDGSITWSKMHYYFPATSQVRVGFWYRIQNCSTGQTPHFSINTGSGDLLRVDMSNTTTWLYVNGSTRDSDVSSSYRSWNHYLIDFKVNSSTGWAYLYKNGVEVCSWSGNTGSSTVAQFVIGKFSYNYTHTTNWDDIYIDDMTGESAPSPGPFLRFYYTLPNGNGNYADWVGSDGNSTDNYALVDEVPPSSSDYVQATAVDDYDSYAMSTFTLDDGQLIRAVIPQALIKRAGTSEEVAIGTRYSSTDSIGSDITPTAVYALYQERQTTKPGGGDWDQTSLDGVEVVLKSRGSY